MADGLLLVHAFPLDASMWEPQVAAFADRLPVVAPSLPGFGGTAGTGEITTMASAAERCVAELDRAGLEHAVVCGLSMGGYVAFELWRTHRERVAGLVLANTRAQADDEEGRRNRLALAERVRREGSASVARALRALLSEGAPAELRDRVEALVRAQTPDAVAAAALGMAARPDSTADLAGIHVPTLVLTSSGDTLIAPEISSPMADAIPDAELAVIEDVGHLSNLEVPEEFNRLLKRHLERCGLL